MIGPISVGMAVYQLFAGLTGRPTISKLSTSRTWGPLIWGWLFGLGWHFIDELRRNK